MGLHKKKRRTTSRILWLQTSHSRCFNRNENRINSQDLRRPIERAAPPANKVTVAGDIICRLIIVADIFQLRSATTCFTGIRLFFTDALIQVGFLANLRLGHTLLHTTENNGFARKTLRAPALIGASELPGRVIFATLVTTRRNDLRQFPG